MDHTSQICVIWILACDKKSNQVLLLHRLLSRVLRRISLIYTSNRTIPVLLARRYISSSWALYLSKPEAAERIWKTASGLNSFAVYDITTIGGKPQSPHEAGVWICFNELWYQERDLNPYSHLGPADFKSALSTTSNILAHNTLISLYTIRYLSIFLFIGWFILQVNWNSIWKVYVE